LFVAFGLILAFIAGIVVGFIASLGELNSIKAQVSVLQKQVTNLTSKNEQLRLSLERLNSTIKLLNEVFQNKTKGAEGLLLKIDTKDTISIGEVVKVKPHVNKLWP
jgi:prefoldin subunit 5